ncbi:unnamed protein product [Tuber aestivum]|uniref:Uncharacterized protein n=1 Tax=Tuber aestivum TaxID=59557 RepID=A0A292PJD3_9PEZI|nr:unnamed protein product [Tuber aestivum]
MVSFDGSPMVLIKVGTCLATSLFSEQLAQAGHSLHSGS